MFATLTLLTLAVGIGANTAIFSVVRGVLLKPLPYPNPDQLIGVWEKDPGLGIKDMNASPATYLTFREQNRTFQDTGIWQSDSVSITGVGRPEQVPAVDLTDGVLPMLGIAPLRGRWFSLADDAPNAPGTAMLSWGYWQRRFGGDPTVIGRRLIIDGKAREVIGIMPREFRFMDMKPDVFLALQFDRGKVFIGNFSYQAAARLKPGVTIEQASADVARMISIMVRTFPPPPGISMSLLDKAPLLPNLRPLKQDVVGDIGKVLWVLMGTVGIILFIACANVANLLLVRAEGRQLELAIRAALGAGWGRIARELLVESMVLGALGGLLGVGLAAGALRLIVATAPADVPRLDQISIDPQVLLFTLIVSLLAGLLFGLVPVVRYAGPRLNTTLREGGRGLSAGRDKHRTRSILVVVQVALALVLLVSSGLMIRTFQALRNVQPGFVDPSHIQTFRISIPDAQVPDNDRVNKMENAMVQSISAVPGVISVSLGDSVTMDGYNDNDPVFAQDRPSAEGKLPKIRRFKFVGPNYFHTMGNPLLAGRDLTWTDIYETHPVVLVSDNLAREYWGSPAAALGKRVRENQSDPWREIIGVVGNERDDGVDHPAPTILYWPLAIRNFWGQAYNVRREVAFAVRTPRAGTASLMDELRQAVWTVDRDLPVAEVHTMSEIYRRSMARTSFTLIMLAIAAGMAMLLGIIGIYGVISYSVSQRTREIGIRIALGAPLAQVRGMFVRHGLVLAGIGVGCGLVVAFALTQLMRALLFEVNPLDPLTYAAVSVVLIGAAFLASYVPARRATVVDPAETLRME